MKVKHYLPVTLLCLVIIFPSAGQKKSFDEIDGADVRVYKTVDGYDLKMNIFYPVNHKKGKKYPAIVFFFGGGWQNGNVHQFEHQCRYLASKGMIAMAAGYRVKSRNNSTPFDAVEDAKSAIRWVRQHAGELGVKKNQIVASGGSAGGHIAACTAIIPGFEASGENLNISSKPNALVLFNPVINTTSNEKLRNKIGDNARAISPADHVTPKLPPTLIFHGKEDTVVPFESILDFQTKMEQEGNICYVVPFDGQGHGFFNYGRSDNKYFEITMENTNSFLIELRYLNPYLVFKR